MDRLEEWRVFGVVERLRSFVAAARVLQRSPQAVTRAIAALEQRLGTRLFNRTTRSVSLTNEGGRYLEQSRGVLADFDRLEAPSNADAELRGVLTVTAPVMFGQLHVVPVVGAFLALHRDLEVRLLLLDRVVSLAEEGIDLGVRIGALPDSALRARVVGHVNAVVCASPAYLARAGTPRTPDSLSQHDCIAFTATTPIPNQWSFRTAKGRERRIAVRPRLTVNTGQAAIDAAVAGLGLVRVISYQVDRLVAEKKLRIVLGSAVSMAVPVQIVHLPGVQSRAAAAFVDFAAQRLRKRIA